MTGAMTRTATKRTRTTATKLTKSSWSPEFIKQAVEDVAEPATEIAVETIEVEEVVRQEEPVPTFSDAGDVDDASADRVLDSHGPDAARIASGEADPKLVEAREWLADLIANPPRYPDGRTGSIPEVIDYYRAVAILERNHDNRKISKVAVRGLIRSLKRGEWMENGQTIGFCIDGTTLNGQHRAEAIRQCGIPGIIDLRFNLPPESRKTMDIGKGRSSSDFLSMRGYANSHSVASAARLMVRYESSPRMARLESVSPIQIEDTVERYPELVVGARKAFGLRKAGLGNASVAGFVWALAVDYDRDVAERFFEKLESGIGLEDKTDVVWKLRSYLANLTGKRRARADEIAAVTIKAFNAFAKNRKIGMLRWLNGGDRPEEFPVMVSRDVSA